MGSVCNVSYVFRHDVLNWFMSLRRMLKRIGTLRFGMPGDFALEIILRPGEFPDSLTHASGEFRQLLGPEENQDDEEDDPHIHGGERRDRYRKDVEQVHIKQTSEVLCGALDRVS